MLYLIAYFALQLNNLAKVIAAYFYTKKLKLEIIVIAPRQPFRYDWKDDHWGQSLRWLWVHPEQLRPAWAQ